MEGKHHHKASNICNMLLTISRPFHTFSRFVLMKVYSSLQEITKRHKFWINIYKFATVNWGMSQSFLSFICTQEETWTLKWLQYQCASQKLPLGLHHIWIKDIQFEMILWHTSPALSLVIFHGKAKQCIEENVCLFCCTNCHVEKHNQRHGGTG